MRELVYSSAFKGDLKRVRSGKSKAWVNALNDELTEALELLQTDAPLPERYADHPLNGKWKLFRDCHVRPDVVLIYRKVGGDELHLARIGSHSTLFKM